MNIKKLIKEIIKANKRNGIRLDLAVRIVCERYDIKPNQFDEIVTEVNRLIKNNEVRI